ncbi:protein jag [Flaviflexus huanghaiensis]|uniref:Jag family protein n=1 Tax=Flaviflexus huanghaiensis TaxID=1111473 RepID=UPI0015FE4BF3|nr:R3H domain-containing nucleic acid-binding protein [Flaviflexus huanghaiensis]
MPESNDREGLFKRLDAEGDIAADYLEELLDLADLDGDIEISVEADRASLAIVTDDGPDPRLKRLVGKNGEVLDALQELTRLAVQTATGERSRLMLDIDGYRAHHRERVLVVAKDAIEEVLETGEAKHLEPMNPFERKVVHDAVAAAGLASDSEGVGPERHVVIDIAADDDDIDVDDDDKNIESEDLEENE